MFAHLLWMNPLWIAALPLALLTPLLAHLLARRGGRLAVFPTIRFLQQAMADESRWRRPVDWLLLILRMLILTMVVLAFARPMWVMDLQDKPAASGGLSLVLIVDASASMQRTAQGITLFDRARSQAIDTLQSLDPSRDRALVVVLDASPRPLLPMMSAHFSQMIQQLRALEPTWEQGNLPAALALAARPPMHAQDRINLAELEIHLYSDMQKSQWPAEPSLARTLRHRKLVLHPLKGETQNVALRRPRVQPAAPIVGQMAQAAVEVVNFSDKPVEARVTLMVEHASSPAAALEPQRMTLPAGGLAQAQFNWQVEGAGLSHLQFALESEGGALAADDRTGLFVEASHARRVALVTTGSTADAGSEAYFMLRALMPAADAQGNDVLVEVWPPGELTQRLASKPPAVVVMIQAGLLEPQWLTSLTYYLNQGGGVWWIIDSDAAAQTLLGWRDEHDQPVSPIVSPTPARAWQPGVERSLSRGSFDDPLLRVFQGSVRSAVLAPRFSQTLVGTLAGDAQGLLHFQDDHPALAARWVGQGRLAVLAGNLSPHRSDWVRQPVFVPLVHQLVRGLSPGPGPAENPLVGSAVHLALPAKAQVATLTIIDPAGREMAVNPTLSIDDSQTLSLPRATLPGPYRVMQNQDPSRTMLTGVQVDLHALESDLTPWQPTLQETGSTAAGASSDLEVSWSDDPAVRQEATALWPWLIVSAIGLMLVEALLSGWSLRHARRNPMAGGVR